MTQPVLAKKIAYFLLSFLLSVGRADNYVVEEGGQGGVNRKLRIIAQR